MARKRYYPLDGMKELIPIDRDQGPALAFTAQSIYKAFEDQAKSHGYLPISLPLAESKEVFDVLGLDGCLCFGEEGVLRPAFQPGLCRTAVEQGLVRSHSGLRFSQVGPVFPAGGETMETWLGVDVMKDSAATVDVEVIVFLTSVLQSVGSSEVTVRLNCVGDEESKVGYLEEMKSGTPCPKDLVDLDSLDLYEEVKEGLAALEVPFEEDPMLCGDYSYLVKTVFSLVIDGVTVGGGGHYGQLVEKLGGPPTDAVGGWIALERLVELLEKRKQLVAPMTSPKVLVAYMDSGVRFEALKLAVELRSAGVETHFVYAAKNIGRQFKVASELDIPMIVVVGGREWDKGQVALKRYGQEKEQMVAVGELVETVKGLV
jgi:histidyl-tRNA synthetase